MLNCYFISGHNYWNFIFIMIVQFWSYYQDQRRKWQKKNLCWVKTNSIWYIKHNKYMTLLSVFRYLFEFCRQNIKSCWLNYNRMCFYSISCISLFSFLIMQLRETNVYCEREYSLESLRLAKTNLTPAGKLSNRCSVIGISWLAHQKLELSDKRINTQR